MNNGRRSIRYRWYSPGFFRINVCGWRFYFYDTLRTWAPFTARTRGLHLGRFIVGIDSVR